LTNPADTAKYMNPRLTKRDYALIKGALRRVFARSELHHKVLNKAIIQHSDPERPRVKTWILCPVCNKPEAKSYCVVDHISPAIKITETLYDLTLQTLQDRIWCEEDNLQPICKSCHKVKTLAENRERRKNRKNK
jgi:5-methylcytosine-specific restriction endonuclease McrA